MDGVGQVPKPNGPSEFIGECLVVIFVQSATDETSIPGIFFKPDALADLIGGNVRCVPGLVLGFDRRVVVVGQHFYPSVG